jgi:hypothetical protein
MWNKMKINKDKKFTLLPQIAEPGAMVKQNINQQQQRKVSKVILPKESSQYSQKTCLTPLQDSSRL